MKISYALLLGCLVALVSVGIVQLSLTTYKTASISPGCEVAQSNDTPSTDTVAYWDGRMLTPHYPASRTELASVPDSQVLGAVSSNRWIEIDLSEQKLRAYDGDQLFLESSISSGLWNKTPVGEYQIWYKIASTKMEGGIKGHRSYYYLPNVPFAMFFKGDYGIHGTYWHNNFGTPRSHGCVNAPTNVAEKIFYWSGPVLPDGKRSVRATKDNPGTRVVVRD